MFAVVLLLLPGVAALLLDGVRHRIDVSTITLLISVALGLPVLWLTWATYREARRSESGISEPMLAGVADELAGVVQVQWTDEAAVRRLNDPYPLAVSWAAGGASPAASWESLVTLARSGAGWPSSSGTESWASGPDGLAGEGAGLSDVLMRVPTGRLLVLGEPGAGKTMLMVRLVLDLLARREKGGPVPVLFSIASWNPAEQSLRDWMAAQLVISYPTLAASTGLRSPSRAAALLAAGLILPVLDGLDEIPDRTRGPAIARINESLRPGQKMVTTCRTLQYRDAAQSTGVPVTLRGAAVVELEPLDADAVRRYLCDDADSPAMKARWEPVLTAIATDAPAGQALTTPLMVGLARTIYNPRPDEVVGALPDPAELCGPDLLDRAAVESHLLDAFIPSVYRSGGDGHTSIAKARPWLTFLACHLENSIKSPDFAWWEMQSTVPLILSGIVAGLAVGLVGAVASALSGDLQNALAVGLGVGLTCCLAMLLTRSRSRLLKPSRGGFWRRRIGGLAPAWIVGVAGIAAADLSGPDGRAGVIVGLAALLVAVVTGGVVVAVRRMPDSSCRPGRRFTVSGLATGFGVGFAGGTGVAAGFVLSGFLGIPVAFWYLGALSGGLAGMLAGAVLLSRGNSVEPAVRYRWGHGARQVGLIVGLASGAVAAGFDVIPLVGGAGWLPAAEIAVGLSGLAGIGLATARRKMPEPSRGARWHPSRRGLWAALLVGIAAFAIVSGFGFVAAVTVGIGAAVAFGLAGGLRGVEANPAATSPQAVLARDRRASLIIALAGFLAVGLVTGAFVGMLSAGEGLEFVPAGVFSIGLDSAITSGLISGVIFGIASSSLNAAWPSYLLARTWLALSRRLPWSLMGFLADAHQRGILRQAGAVYQFRHIELQHRLATKAANRDQLGSQIKSRVSPESQDSDINLP